MLSILYCNAIQQCNPEVEIASRFRKSDFEEMCRSESEHRFRDETLAGMAKAEEKGSFNYDPEAAPGCLQKLTDLKCHLFDSSLFDVCEETFQGQTKRSCVQEYECGANSRCNLNESCPGFCTEKTTTGRPCDESLECEGAHYCSEISLTCEPIKEAGDECDEADTRSQCVEGTFCSAGICKKNGDLYVGTLGDACSPDERCRAGFSCAATSEGNRCLARVNQSESCFLGFPSHCKAGSFCSAELGDGAKQGVCSTLLSEGAACTSSAQCDGELACTKGRCLLRLAIGEKCAADAACWTENCLNGECVERNPCADSKHSSL